jgi:hypothetical protein
LDSSPNAGNDRLEVCDATGKVVLTWNYSPQHLDTLRLYQLGKKKQWDSDFRIDWNQDPYLEQPELDYAIGLAGSTVWDRLDENSRSEIRKHILAWNASQFLHGEQGALSCSAKILQNLDDVESKYFLATQVIDEARHMEAYSRYIGLLEVSYPINPNLSLLLEQILSDSRWDLTVLGMQILIEGLALAAFGLIRNTTPISLLRQITAYVMADEARHVAFGRSTLRRTYRELSTKELAEREEFCAEACLVMRDRFLAQEVWENFGLPAEECSRHLMESESHALFRAQLFSRIVPSLHQIGLLGPKLTRVLDEIGVLQFATADLDQLFSEDEKIADSISGKAK